MKNIEDKYPLIHPKTIFNKLNIGGSLYNNSADGSVILTNTDTFVVTLCNGKNSVEDIIQEVLTTYDIKENRELCTEQVKSFINSLYQKKFLFMSENRINIPQLDYLNSIYDFSDDDTEYTIPENLQTLSLGIIEACPLQCIYCLPSAPKIKENKTILSFEKAKELIDDASSLGARILVLTGGEPLIHPDIYRITQYAYDKGFYDVKVSTKATMITQRKALKLRQSGLKEIQVSIDSNKPDTYDKMVGIDNCYAKAMEGLYNLMYYNFRIIIKSVVTKYNIDDIPSLCEDMIAKGVDELQAEIVLPTGRAQKEMLPTLEQLNTLEKELKEIENKYNLDYKILGYRKYGNAAVCSGGINSVAVFSNGDVSLCERVSPLLEHVKCGNVYNNSLISIWRSDEMNKFRKLRTNDADCKKCSSKQVCLGGCLLNTWIKFKDITKADPSCVKKYGKEGQPLFIEA